MSILDEQQGMLGLTAAKSGNLGRILNRLVHGFDAENGLKCRMGVRQVCHDDRPCDSSLVIVVIRRVIKLNLFGAVAGEHLTGYRIISEISEQVTSGTIVAYKRQLRAARGDQL